MNDTELGHRFNNSSFEEHLNANRFKGALYYFTLEAEEDHWELGIHSSSLSELDEDEEGHLEGYSYMDEVEALEDISIATDEFQICFEELKN